KSYCIIGTVEVIVNGARDADHGKVLLARQQAGPGKGPISPNNNQAVDLVLLQAVVSSGTPFLFKKFRTSRSFQESAPRLDDIAYGGGVQFYHVIIYQSVLSTPDPIHFQLVLNSGTHYRTDG